MWQVLMECEGVVRDFEMQVRRRDGTIIWVEDTARVVRDAGGQVQYYEGSLEDITERKRAEEELKRRNVELGILNEIAESVSRSLELKTTLDDALAATVAAVQGDVGGVYLRDESGQALELVASRGLEGDLPGVVRRRSIGQDLAGWIVQANRPLRVADMCTNPHLRPPELEEWRARQGLRGFLGAPLRAQGKAIGVIAVLTRSARDFSDQDERMLVAISRHVSIAIDNATLFEGLQRSNVELALAYDTTLEGWSKALELRDYETKGHSRRVTAMTIRLARALGRHAYSPLWTCTMHCAPTVLTTTPGRRRRCASIFASRLASTLIRR